MKLHGLRYWRFRLVGFCRYLRRLDDDVDERHVARLADVKNANDPTDDAVAAR